jgi:hypothetical protein
MSLGGMTSGGEHQQDSVFGGRNTVDPGGIHHQDAARGGRRDIDVVDSHTSPTDHPEFRGHRKKIRVDSGAASNQQRIVCRDERAKLGLRQPGLDVDRDIRLFFEPSDTC